MACSSCKSTQNLKISEYCGKFQLFLSESENSRFLFLTVLRRAPKMINDDKTRFSECSFIFRYGGGPPRFGGGGGSRGGPPPGKFGNPGERLRKKHWNLDELPKFQKNFYQEHPDTSRRSLVRPAHCCISFPNFKEMIFLFVRYFLNFVFLYSSKRLNNTDEAKK